MSIIGRLHLLLPILTHEIYSLIKKSQNPQDIQLFPSLLILILPISLVKYVHIKNYLLFPVVNVYFRLVSFRETISKTAQYHTRKFDNLCIM